MRLHVPPCAHGAVVGRVTALRSLLLFLAHAAIRRAADEGGIRAALHASPAFAPAGVASFVVAAHRSLAPAPRRATVGGGVA